MKILGVVTTDGRTIIFERPGAELRNDTLIARVGERFVTVALVDAERVIVERREGDAVATVFAVIGVVFAGLLVAGGVAAATKESCPFVYAWDGEQFVFDAEPYGGAITRGLERDDYSALDHLRQAGGEYRIRVTNEVNETQHTNFMELWVVDHQPGARIMADASGNLYAVEGLQLISATDALGTDLLPWLATTDRLIWEPMSTQDSAGNLQQTIQLTFPRDPTAPEARLVVNAATGLWGSHMIREFVQLRGEAGAHEWFARLDTDSASLAELHEWNLREQLYVLRVYVDEPTGWELRGAIMGEGPFIAHDRVVTLDVSRARGDQLRIRIEPPRGFWALNSFGIDYSSSAPLVPTRVPLVGARTADGVDISGELAAVDDSYYDMPDIGNRAEVWFDAPSPVPGKERSVILHSRGYYDLHLDHGVQANENLLREIEQRPGSGLEFAADLYADWTEEQLRERVEKIRAQGD